MPNKCRSIYWLEPWFISKNPNFKLIQIVDDIPWKLIVAEMFYNPNDFGIVKLKKPFKNCIRYAAVVYGLSIKYKYIGKNREMYAKLTSWYCFTENLTQQPY